MNDVKKDIIQILIEVLNESIPNCHAANEIPKDLPKNFIVVKRDGGERRAMVLDMADILISIYDKDSAPHCATLANFIADAIPTLVGVNPDITHAHVNTVYESNDTARQYHRYEVSCSVYYRR